MKYIYVTNNCLRYLPFKCVTTSMDNIKVLIVFWERFLSSPLPYLSSIMAMLTTMSYSKEELFYHTEDHSR